MLKFFLLCIVACYVINHTTYAQDVDMNWQNENYQNSTVYQNVTPLTTGAYQVEVYKEKYVAVAYTKYVMISNYLSPIFMVDLLDFLRAKN